MQWGEQYFFSGYWKTSRYAAAAAAAGKATPPPRARARSLRLPFLILLCPGPASLNEEACTTAPPPLGGRIGGRDGEREGGGMKERQQSNRINLVFGTACSLSLSLTSLPSTRHQSPCRKTYKICVLQQQQRQRSALHSALGKSKLAAKVQLAHSSNAGQCRTEHRRPVSG